MTTVSQLADPIDELRREAELAGRAGQVTCSPLLWDPMPWDEHVSSVGALQDLGVDAVAVRCPASTTSAAIDFLEAYAGEVIGPSSRRQ
jgi:hypothetical protein